MEFPDNLRYTNDHEWVRIEGSTAFVGVTAHAASELGDVVFVDVEEDATVSKGDSFGTIEAVKTVADLYAPLSGKVVEVNSSLGDSPENINNDPYGDGWIVKIEISDAAEADELLTVEAYKDLVGA